MDINDLRSIFTVLAFVMFVGIVWWAYSGRRKQAYEEAAQLPLDDDDDLPSIGSGSIRQVKETRHGLQ